ncbi:MAG: hypothetical protein WKF29_07630 [Thermoleophilaceae bacterium]
MDTSRISFGEMVAAVSGLVLLIVMFFPWYQTEAEMAGSNSSNAWEVFSFVDLLLLLVVLVAVGVAVARAAGAMPTQLPAPPGMIVAAAGALALLLIIFRLISIPGGDVDIDGVDFDRQIGIFLGLLAAAGITFGGFTAMNERNESATVDASGSAGPGATA